MTANEGGAKPQEGNVPSAGGTPEPQRDELLDLIDKEITGVDARSVRDGWTLQATLAALGAIAWIVLGEVESGYPPPEQFAAIVLTCSCLIDGCVTLVDVVRMRVRPDEARFAWPAHVISSRPAALSAGLRDVLLCLLAYTLLREEAGIARWAPVLYFGAAGFFEVTGAAVLPWTLRAMPLNLPMHNTGTSLRVKLLLSTGGAVLVIALLVHLVPVVEPRALSHVLKVGGGVAVFLALAARLERTGPHTALADVLTELRRRLVLKQVSVAVAGEAIDIVVKGLRVAHVLQPRIARIVQRCEEANSLMEKVSEALVAPPSVERDGGSDAAPRPGPARCRAMLEQVDRVIETAERRMVDLHGAVRGMCVYAPSTAVEAPPLIDQVTGLLQKTKAMRAQIVLPSEPRKDSTSS